MRLLHLVFLIAVIAVVLTLARDPITRVFMVVFVTGLGEVTFGLAAVLALFQTIGSLGEAKGASAHAEAIVATSLVLAVATAVMSAWLLAGAWVVAVTT